MHIVLFDWTCGGHHVRYLHHAAAALAPVADVTVAAPDQTLDELADLPVATYALGSCRPPVDLDRPLGPQHGRLADAELDLLDQVIRALQPDHLVHLYADPVLRRLVRRPALRARISLCVFFARAHYPTSLGSRLPPRELARAWLQWGFIQRWRRRSDAHALFLLDQRALHLAGLGRGAAVFWLPEPPVAALPEARQSAERSGIVLYGALAARKGIDLLAAAVAARPGSPRVTLAGAVEPQFEAELERHVRTMRQADAIVHLRPGRHDECKGLETLARGRCAVLPYPQHYGMSRVLLEASAVGTPVVVHDFGLIGHVVRTCGLGLAVDCRNPGALRNALDQMCADSNVTAYAENLRAFAERFSEARFQQAIQAPFLIARNPGTDRPQPQPADSRPRSALTGEIAHKHAGILDPKRIEG